MAAPERGQDKGGVPRPARVPLAYPFTVDRRRIASVVVAPPTLDALDTYRAVAEPRPADLVVALIGEGPYIVGQMRWLDAARVIEAGLDMLPDDIRADFAAALAAAQPDADAEPVVTDAPADPAFEPAPTDAPDMTDFLHRTDGLMIDG
jgi:hypothetical protein